MDGTAKTAFNELCGKMKEAHAEALRDGIKNDKELREISLGVLESCFIMGAKWAALGCP